MTKTHDFLAAFVADHMATFASGPDVGTLVPLEGKMVPYMGPEWMAHLRAEGQEYAERAGAPAPTRREGR